MAKELAEAMLAISPRINKYSLMLSGIATALLTLEAGVLAPLVEAGSRWWWWLGSLGLVVSVVSGLIERRSAAYVAFSRELVQGAKEKVQEIMEEHQTRESEILQAAAMAGLSASVKISNARVGAMVADLYNGRMRAKLIASFKDAGGGPLDSYRWASGRLQLQLQALTIQEISLAVGLALVVIGALTATF